MDYNGNRRKPKSGMLMPTDEELANWNPINGGQVPKIKQPLTWDGFERRLYRRGVAKAPDVVEHCQGIGLTPSQASRLGKWYLAHNRDKDGKADARFIASFFSKLTAKQASKILDEPVTEPEVKPTAEPPTNGKPKKRKKGAKPSAGADLHVTLAANGRGLLPTVPLPNENIPLTYTAGLLGGLMAATGKYYIRGGALVRLRRDDDGRTILEPVKPASLPSDFERVAALGVIQSTEGGQAFRQAVCSESTAKLIVAAEAFQDPIPTIRVLSRCPVLIDRGGRLDVVTGYDRDSGVYAEGEPPEEMDLGQAVALLLGILRDFRFATPADKSRAVAALITPALVFGGLLRGRAPVDLGEADQSQAGKGYRNKITAAIYGWEVTPITQRRGGVGGLEESYNHNLIAGANFISFDNLRGKLDSPSVESSLTEDKYVARVPYSGNIEIDMRRVVVMMTSNRAEFTDDFGNRCSCVRMLKQPPGYQYASYPEGDALEHVRANRGKYLGAVFAVVRAWYAAGQPKTTEARHDFRAWAQRLDWIVQNLFGLPPLVDGHQETKLRMTKPHLNWLRDVGLTVVASGQAGEWLRTHHLLTLLDGAGVELPGVGAETDLEDDANRKKALQGIGRRLGHCFAGAESLTIDHITIERRQATDESGRPYAEYRFEAAPPDESPYTPASPPLVDPLINPNVSASSPSGSKQFSHAHAHTRAHARDKPETYSGTRGTRGKDGQSDPEAELSAAPLDDADPQERTSVTEPGDGHIWTYQTTETGRVRAYRDGRFYGYLPDGQHQLPTAASAEGQP